MFDDDEGEDGYEMELDYYDLERITRIEESRDGSVYVCSSGVCQRVTMLRVNLRIGRDRKKMNRRVSTNSTGMDDYFGRVIRETIHRAENRRLASRMSRHRGPREQTSDGRSVTYGYLKGLLLAWH